ncbi:hypothetical protein [Cytobacillus horneckiae]|uniref:hypothetical protein n=1 Tax=Cytobacillus horneckiae TaxID=549687 RepID=UPI003D9A40E9
MNKYEGLTWNDLVRKYMPNASDSVCNFILWEKTAFPLASPEYIERQIENHVVNTHAERRSNFPKNPGVLI